ncbi:hypothetical protein MASRES_GEN12905_02090 [Acinetobacter baumannii]
MTDFQAFLLLVAFLAFHGWLSCGEEWINQ